MAEEVDSKGSTRAARYRELAAALRTLAPTLKNTDARKELHAIARNYEVLAERAERGADRSDLDLEQKDSKAAR